ncbi:MAG: N-carbamoylsarcosine amidase [Noviherbaspirillum sp.]|nr:N-carbamoylsarcosine amidase [Noviherbaspirillum sp.]
MSQTRTPEEDAKFFAARGFGKRIGFGNRAALVVIDYINAFTDASMPLGSDLDAELAQTNLLIDEAHAQRLTVIYSTVAYDEDGYKDAGIWALKQSGLSTLKAGTPAVELDRRLHREPADILIATKYASCFYGTDLVARLNARQIDTLILTGCTTSGCVRSTAVDALQNGFRPIIARDAVGDRSLAAHNQSLFDLDQKYGDVMTVEEILAELRKRAMK